MESKKINTKKIDKRYEKIRKFDLFILKLLIFFIICDLSSTYLSVFHFQIAEEGNKVVLFYWELFGYYIGTFVILCHSVSILGLVGYGLVVSDRKRKLEKGFILFATTFLIIMFLGYILVLINNFSILFGHFF